MFTEKAQGLLGLAKNIAFTNAQHEITLSVILAAVAQQSEACVLLAECCNMELEAFRAICPRLEGTTECPQRLPLAASVREMLGEARELAQEAPDQSYPGLVGLRHLTCAIAISQEACELLKTVPISRDVAIAKLSEWCSRDATLPRLDSLTEELRRVRTVLLNSVCGQNHAVHAFVEGLFNAEVVAAAEPKRKRPRAVFVFAGPPGVGKTYLAELGASALNRPYRRFDMSGFSDHQAHSILIGHDKTYSGSHPGQLTEFVEKNPTAVLLFDEVEKAHLNTVHLFLQVLDAGILEDKYFQRNVSFRDTTLIFTTNAGRSLYDQPNASGIHGANSAFHRKTILDALENEKDSRTGQPFFPPAICSRIASGYPLLFNHLGVNDLERVVRAELNQVAGLLESQYYKRVSFHPHVPLCLLLKEGVRADARTLCSQAAIFVKAELYKFCQLFHAERIEEVLNQFDQIHFLLDGRIADLDSKVAALLEPQRRPHVLLIADAPLGDLYRDSVPEIEWSLATTSEEAIELLAELEVDMVLLDLWVGQHFKIVKDPIRTVQQFDHVPAAARGLEKGQELLRKIHERLPNIPVFLLSVSKTGDPNCQEGSIDEELFLACLRGGGARGMIVTSFTNGRAADREQCRDRFANQLIDACHRLYRQRSAERIGQERKILAFDTVPRIEAEDRRLLIRLRNLRLATAVAAEDASEILADVERPRTRFDDVIGADAAKEELNFFIDFLKNPRRFAALGLKPPKGVLLHGPPGTGKTMLARAMAGESEVAFLSASASSFVTIWQGSGPQNIRDLFARARRYAPAIIFIDEIDAIGRVRTGGAGGAEATENTLNALLTELDGFTSPSTDRPVFVLAATNFNVQGDDQNAPERSARTLDPALVRRFARTILVDLPDRAAREKYLAIRLANRAGCTVPDEIIKLISERSTGMSIANLESIIETAARNAAKTGGDLTAKLLEEAFETVRFGEARARDPDAVKRTACHEAGHTILYWLSGWWPAYVTIVSRGSHGGYMAPSAEEIEQRASQTRDELLASIRVSFGGRAAETIVYGRDAGLSTGASADLENATSIARQMVCRYGMDDEFGLLVTPELMKYEAALSSPMYLKVNETASRILKEQMEGTLKRLEENRQYLDIVSRALCEKERLTEAELRKLLPELPDPMHQVNL